MRLRCRGGPNSPAPVTGRRKAPGRPVLSRKIVLRHQRLHVGPLCCRARRSSPGGGLPRPSPGLLPPEPARFAGAGPVPAGGAGAAPVPPPHLRALPGPRRRDLPGHRLPVSARGHRRPGRAGPGSASGAGALPRAGPEPRGAGRHPHRPRPGGRHHRAGNDLWYSSKGRRFAGNLRFLSAPDGSLLWVSEVEPGSVHDLRAARIHALPALYAAARHGLPTLVDVGHTGAGIGMHTPFRPHPDVPAPWRSAVRGLPNRRGLSPLNGAGREDSGALIAPATPKSCRWWRLLPEPRPPLTAAARTHRLAKGGNVGQHARRTTPFVTIQDKAEDGPHPCPRCGFLTLSERGTVELCPVCFWEDDGQDDHDADQVRGGPNGRPSLAEARRNFHAPGACDERCIPFVRAPLPDEHPTV